MERDARTDRDMIWRFGRHFALVVLVCVVVGKREISLSVVPGGGHFVLVLYVWYAKDVDLSRGKTNEVPIVKVRSEEIVRPN